MTSTYSSPCPLLGAYPYRQAACDHPPCGHQPQEGLALYQRLHRPQPGPQPELLHFPMEDPSSRSSAVLGGVASCLVAIPFVGGILGIIFGLIAVRRARRGRMAVQSSAGSLRGKGAYIAGMIMGWCAFGLGILMTIYYLILLAVIAAR